MDGGRNLKKCCSFVTVKISLNWSKQYEFREFSSNAKFQIARNRQWWWFLSITDHAHTQYRPCRSLPLPIHKRLLIDRVSGLVLLLLLPADKRLHMILSPCILNDPLLYGPISIWLSIFLVACTRIYNPLCRLVGQSAHRSPLAFSAYTGDFRITPAQILELVFNITAPAHPRAVYTASIILSYCDYLSIFDNI